MGVGDWRAADQAQAELVIDGASGELDRQVLERMLPPFEHILRNAVAHGIEPPAEREARGKPATGRITLALRREGAEVIVQLSDDGAGMNLKAIRDKGQALGYVANEIDTFVKNKSGNGRLKDERELLATALTDVQGMAATLTGYLMAAQEDPKSIYKVGTASVRFLMSVGDLVMGWLLLRQSAVAMAALDAGASGSERSFYEGKIAAASFFAKNFLPLLTGVRQVVESVDNEIMELDEASF